MGLVLLDHFNLNGKIHIQNLNYQEVLQGFNKGTIDAAFITVGTHAPIFRRLAESGTCDFIDIPHYRALEKNYLFTYPYEIPAITIQLSSPLITSNGILKLSRRAPSY